MKKRTKKKNPILVTRPGLDHLTWNAVLDRYIITNTMDVSYYEKMNEEQITVIQELKKAFKRLKQYNNKQDADRFL